MKKYKRIFLAGIAIFIIGVMILGGLTLFGLANPNIIKAADQKIRVKQGLYKEPIQKIIVVDEQVNQINIDVQSDNVVIKDSDVEKITITYYENFKGETQYQTLDGILNFKLNFKFSFSFEMFSWIYQDLTKLNIATVEIPHESNINYDVKVSSGNINFNQIKAGIIKTSVSSGNTDITNTTASGVNSSASSGNVTFNNCNIANELIVKVSSGNMTLNDVTSNTFESNSSSGNTKLYDCVTTSYKGNSKSGNIYIENLQSEVINLSNISGSIEISQLVYSIDDYNTILKTSSGYIKIGSSKKGEYYENLSPERPYTLNASVSSGVIKIY